MFRYYSPAPHLHGLIGSYYRVAPDFDLHDILRAEMPNLRFFQTGFCSLDLARGPVHAEGPAAVLFGPTYSARHGCIGAGTKVVGAAVTHAGWQRFFGMPMHELADTAVDLFDLLPPRNAGAARRILETEHPDELPAPLDDFFTALLAEEERRADAPFMAGAAAWLLKAERRSIDDLVTSVDKSSRQIERLARVYFGAPPKRLQRKYRTLKAANRMVWLPAGQDPDFWQDFFYDQPHFIREFRQFIGSTPGAFLAQDRSLNQHTIRARRSIRHGSPFSLIA